MKPVRVIACLDVEGAKVAKGVQFENLRHYEAPEAMAAQYEVEGADEVVFLDIAATTEARATKHDAVRHTAEVLNVPLIVGGGIRSIADARRLFNVGAAKVSVGSAALLDPGLISALAAEFGSDRVVVAIDAEARDESSWAVCSHAGTRVADIDVVSWAKEAQERGAGEILLTAKHRDGMQSGYDLALLEAVCREVAIPVIASGGGASAAHAVAAVKAGADTVLLASALHDRLFTIAEFKDELRGLGMAVLQPKAPLATRAPSKA